MDAASHIPIAQVQQWSECEASQAGEGFPEGTHLYEIIQTRKYITGPLRSVPLNNKVLLNIK